MKSIASASGSIGTKQSTRQRVLILDDHPVMREGLAILLDRAGEFTVCGEAANAEIALDLIQKLKPRIAIVDIQLQGASGIEFIKNARAIDPNLLFLVISMHDECFYAERALRAGATGYLCKREASDKVLPAIRTILAGEVYLSDEAKGRMLHRLVDVRRKSAMDPTEGLSDREMEIFQLIGDGYSTREIAGRLNLSTKTVDSYREHLKSKLHVSSGADLVRHAIQWQRNESYSGA